MAPEGPEYGSELGSANSLSAGDPGNGKCRVPLLGVTHHCPSRAPKARVSGVRAAAVCPNTGREDDDRRPTTPCRRSALGSEEGRIGEHETGAHSEYAKDLLKASPSPAFEDLATDGVQAGHCHSLCSGSSLARRQKGHRLPPRTHLDAND